MFIQLYMHVQLFCALLVHPDQSRRTTPYNVRMYGSVQGRVFANHLVSKKSSQCQIVKV